MVDSKMIKRLGVAKGFLKLIRPQTNVRHCEPPVYGTYPITPNAFIYNRLF